MPVLAALASDPSVLMSNPAGIAALKGTQVSFNGQAVLGDLGFRRDSANDFAGNEGGNPLPMLPGSSFFISHQIDERASVGFGLYGNFGLSADYDDDWAGRYFTQKSTLLGISLQPTFAYAINDKVSVGIGPRLVVGYYNTEMAVDNNALLPVSPFKEDGQVQYKDSTTGVGSETWACAINWTHAPPWAWPTPARSSSTSRTRRRSRAFEIHCSIRHCPACKAMGLSCR